jgi:hypothetical protein
MSHPENAKAYLSHLINEVQEWVPFQIDDEYVTDENHKTLTEKHGDTESITQFKLITNPNAKLFQLGFTIDEAQTIIDSE